MALLFYLVPKAGVGTDVDPFRPKYIVEIGVRWAGMAYGLEPTCLVSADVMAGQHTQLIANADVSAFPQNLDVAVGVNVTTVQVMLENINLPGAWVNAAHTFRQVLRGIGTVIQIAQRLDGLFNARVFESGITLATTMAELTQTQRDRLLMAAESFGLDTSAATGSTTMRQVLRAFAQQLPSFQLLQETLA